MKVGVQFALALGVVCASRSDATATNGPAADAWESRPPANLRDCSDLDESLVVPVPVRHRLRAIARLKNVAIVKLSRSDSMTLLGRRPGNNWSGRDEVRSAIERLKEQRLEELEHRKGSWSLHDQQRLDGLMKMIADPRTSELRPFLVRAVAKNERTGGFFASLCGESLEIIHGSLGYSTPSSIRAPVIVFLRTKPRTIYVSWEMAE